MADVGVGALGPLVVAAALLAALLAPITHADPRALSLATAGSTGAPVLTDQRRYVVWELGGMLQTLDTKRLRSRPPLALPTDCRADALSDANVLLACSQADATSSARVRGRVLDVLGGKTRSVPFPDPVDGFGAFGRVWVEASVSVVKANEFFVDWRNGRVRDEEPDIAARDVDDRRLGLLSPDRPVLLRRGGRLLLRVGRRSKPVRLATCRPACRSATASRRGATWIQNDTVYAYDRSDRHRGSIRVPAAVADPVDGDLGVQHTLHAIVVTTTNAGRMGGLVRAGRWP